jgi:hypothetical protein
MSAITEVATGLDGLENGMTVRESPGKVERSHDTWVELISANDCFGGVCEEMIWIPVSVGREN